MTGSSGQPSPASQPLEIAHVLFMDIQAYSLLSVDDQTRLLATLQQTVRNSHEFAYAFKRHKLLSLPTGDGMALVFFGDAESPVRCALEIAAALREHPELKLRMGIHTGPVRRVADINANRNVAGGGVNIAQRVMSCADPGHILVSKATADVLAEIGEWKKALQDLGEAEVKHGVRLHLFNLCTPETGNPRRPASLVRMRLRRVRRFLLPVAAAVVIAGAVVTWLVFGPKAHALGEADTIVLADFDNKTGDEVFDDALKQALTVSLRQSPFLNVLSDDKVAETLRLMARPGDTPLEPQVARELCERAGSKAYIAGSITPLGSEYVVGVKAVNCHSGDVLAEQQVTASRKEKVLDALGGAASMLRSQLGESLSSVQKFDVPLAQATTVSLDALKALSLGAKAERQGGPAAALPYYQRAVKLDPDFALANEDLGDEYNNLGQPALAAEYLTKAFQLREHASERERLYIASAYYMLVTGELEKAVDTYKELIGNYPRNGIPYTNLSAAYAGLGQLDKSLEAAQEAVRLDPLDVVSVDNLGVSYLGVERFDESRALLKGALAQHLDDDFLRMELYNLAFLAGDSQEMQEQVAWFESKPEFEHTLRATQADTEAYFGRLQKSRDFARRAVQAALRAQNKEAAASFHDAAAIREHYMGNSSEARHDAEAALSLVHGTREVTAQAAFVLAGIGDITRAEAQAQDLAKRFPLDTVAQSYWLPTIRARIALTEKNPSRALEILQAVQPLDFSISTNSSSSCLNGIYTRGEAYLAVGQGPAAAAEFQKILGHRGLVQNCVTGAIARRQLARAYALSGDTAKARAEYQAFLLLWKDADPGVPILLQAKSELARLH